MAEDSRRDIDWGNVVLFDREGDPLSPAARSLAGLPPLEPPAGKRWVDVLDSELDYHCLVEAYFEREVHGESDAGRYHRQEVGLLEELLGVSLDPTRMPQGMSERSERILIEASREVSSERRPRSELHAAQSSPEQVVVELCLDALIAIRQHRAISMPASIIRYEGCSHPLLRELNGRHRKRFRGLATGLRRASHEFVADVLRTLDPGVVERRVRRTQLFDRGLPWWPPEEDPFDAY